VRIRLLGEVGAVTDQGEPADVGPAKCQAVLAALALAAGTAVPEWRLVDLVWGQDPPRTAGRTLQSYVVRLRKGLGHDSIVRVGAAYRLAVTPDSVDALRFQQRMDAGDIEAALTEWTGLPLAGLAVPGLAPTVDGLVERWLVAVETDLECRVRADGTAAIGPLTELTARYPTREGLWALLMTALYQAGRQADALAAYRTARQHLTGDLGVEPGPRLRELQARILDHDERLVRGQPARAAAADGPPGNLPRRLGRLIGRERDLEVIAGALAAVPVVTLTGPGGIGKTRLALAAARQAEADDGAWLADLTEITAAGDVPRAVAGALGIKEGTGLPLSRSIVAALRPRRLLLVLDNCEHVVDGAAELAQAIAEGCPQVRILATSRQHLGLSHGFERLIAVTPLDPAGPGAELFGERASAVSPAFDAQAWRPAVVEICRRLDGVPLAIELAAARTTSLTPADIAGRLDDHLRLLARGPRAGAGRHRTLRATIEWSYDLLSPSAQRLFQRLSVFVGPFGLAAAETVAADPALPAADVGDLLGDLVERSMLVVEPGSTFRMLETMRQFAAGRLAESGDVGPVAERHARWCLSQGRHIQRLLAGPAEIEGVARLGELWPNYRAAFDWACTAGPPDLAYALVRPVVVEVVRRSRTEIGDWVERLLAATSPGDTELVLFGLTWAAQRYKLGQDPGGYERLAGLHGEPDHPLAHHARASAYQDFGALAKWAPLAIADLRQRGEDDLAEQFELDAAAGLLFTGPVEEGEAAVAVLAERYRRHGPPTLLHLSLMLLGYSASAQGQPGRAERFFDEAVDVPVPERTQSPGKSVEARTAFRRGHQARAFRLLAAYIDELLGTGNMQAICVTSVEFVTMMVAIGRLDDAALMLGHLDRSAPYWAPQVAEARSKIAAAPPAPSPEPADLDDHQALEYMRSVLLRLARDREAGPGPG
jgi:predicted ATPase/DNA-binding SARP family transcriptional activator